MLFVRLDACINPPAIGPSPTHFGKPITIVAAGWKSGAFLSKWMSVLRAPYETRPSNTSFDSQLGLKGCVRARTL